MHFRKMHFSKNAFFGSDLHEVARILIDQDAAPGARMEGGLTPLVLAESSLGEAPAVDSRSRRGFW